MYKYLHLDKRGSTALVTLDRPKALNALNAGLVDELAAVVAEVAATEGLRALVVTGAGRAFVAGADIAEMQAMTPQDAQAFARRGQAVGEALESLPIPTIAAVNGFALGGGCELAMCCDIILASDKALFGQPEVKLGVIPGFGGTQRLSRYVGRQRARELCFTGRNVSASEAVVLGLAMAMVEGDVVEAALKLASKIARNGPQAVGLAKRAINEGSDGQLAAGLELEAELFGACFGDEQVEGMAAFLEKRSPTFSA